jgi:hypothetical protein
LPNKLYKAESDIRKEVATSGVRLQRMINGKVCDQRSFACGGGCKAVTVVRALCVLACRFLVSKSGLGAELRSRLPMAKRRRWEKKVR